MATKKAKSAKANLRDANKEVKSLSGVIKIVATFWSKGYKEAFADFGIKFADLNLPTIKPMLQTNEQGEIFVMRKVDKKDEQGEAMKDEQGKRIKEEKAKVVTVWTVNTLFDVLDQTRENK